MVKLYTIGCKNCIALENKLNEKHIEYETITDKDVMVSKGFNFMPVLEVDGNTMSFAEAVKWVNRQGEKQ